MLLIIAETSRCEVWQAIHRQVKTIFSGLNSIKLALIFTHTIHFFLLSIKWHNILSYMLLNVFTLSKHDDFAHCFYCITYGKNVIMNGPLLSWLLQDNFTRTVIIAFTDAKNILQRNKLQVTCMMNNNIINFKHFLSE
jgi:hypothetical protein